MKRITILFALFVGFISCETTDLSNNQNNYVLNSDLEGLINEIQLDLPKLIEKTGKYSGSLIRQEYFFGDFYEDSLYDNYNTQIWDLAYSNLLQKMDEAIQIAEIEGAFNHLGVLKTLKAYTLITLVDLYGDIPYSELALPNPSLDTGESVYEIALIFLNNALIDFGVQSANLEMDYYYNNDFNKWEKLANTLKMKIYNTRRLVDPNAITLFENIVNTGNYISSNSDDFEFKYANSEMNHPNYERDYTATGAGRYRSNWLMDTMLNLEDPRRRYYFYRQVGCVPGNFDENGIFCTPVVFDEAIVLCLNDNQPLHYPADMVFCSVSHGYWGRDHGYSEGIPPDAFKRSIIGVYPAGGKFDGSEFVSTAPGIGGQGQGVTPMLLSSWVDFMQAEMALVNNENGAANLFMLTGVQRSIDKVKSFISLDADANLDFVPSNAEVNSYINTLSNSFDNGTNEEKWNILGEQQLIATYGNGLSSYNFYRKTGYPTSLQFHLNENSGALVRSFLYPQEVVDGSTNINQKENVEEKVFWDTNPAFPAFPFAN